MSAAELFTFGHSTASRAALGELLSGAAVDAVVDVRTAPGSRRD
ncbi:DNA repair protein, partial [Streptomyces sp. NPDC002491]